MHKTVEFDGHVYVMTKVEPDEKVQTKVVAISEREVRDMLAVCERRVEQKHAKAKHYAAKAKAYRKLLED